MPVTTQLLDDLELVLALDGAMDESNQLEEWSYLRLDHRLENVRELARVSANDWLQAFRDADPHAEALSAFHMQLQRRLAAIEE